MTPRATDPAPAQVPLRAGDGSPIYTVSQLTREIRDTLERHLGRVWVTGEISNFRRPESGHCYFTLKDAHAQISVVMWRSTAARLKFELKDGLSLLVQGELTVYEPRGRYQIVLRRAEPLGAGALQLAFLQLKERLAGEGLFDADRKKPLPLIPGKIAIVTSPTGAAVRDMLNVILRRFPGAHVLIFPVRVQGSEAAAEIAEAVSLANHSAEIDVMIVGRGGGSLEDLWPFNEEVVARAIAASRIPVVSAVGHETDFTIADFVADVRALTPTDAGRLVVPDAKDLAGELRSQAGRLGQALLGRVALARERLVSLGRSYALRRPLDRIRVREQRLDELCQQFYRSLGHIMERKRQWLDALVSQLESLSPLAVLGRGYSITFADRDGAVLRDASAAKPGDLVRTRLAKGQFTSRVEAGTGRKTPVRRRKSVRRTARRSVKEDPSGLKGGESSHGKNQGEV